MEALQHFKVRKSVAHLHGECSEAKQLEKVTGSPLSQCLDVWCLSSHEQSSPIFVLTLAPSALWEPRPTSTL